jgi:hypothetical protein
MGTAGRERAALFEWDRSVDAFENVVRDASGR